MKLIKNNLENKKAIIDNINTLFSQIIQNGANIIISACTDSSAFIEQLNIPVSIKYIDSTDILARKVISFYSECANKVA